MEDDPQPGAQSGIEILKHEVLFASYFRLERLTLRHRRPDGSWTEPYTREVFERGHAVAVLPYDPIADRVVLIEQLRPPLLLAGVPPRQLEIVAGIVEPGESLEEVARRELTEEAGLVPGSLRPIQRLLPSPGASSETVMLYLGLVDSGGAGGHHGLAEEHEDIRVIVLDAAEAFALSAEGRIENAVAAVALQWLQLNHASLRAPGGLPPAAPNR